MYDDGWLRFTNWATGRGFDPLGPTAAQKAAFLYELFDTHGVLPQTLKSYRSCLASVLSCTGRAAEVQAKTISDMIMSMELQRPKLTPVLPQWDLGIVLEALSKPPYEPLRETSLKHLTLKTLSQGGFFTTKVDFHASIQGNKNFPGKVIAHEVRPVATSLQLFNKADLQAVMKEVVQWRHLYILLSA